MSIKILLFKMAFERSTSKILKDRYLATKDSLFKHDFL